ncbi:unnamed protein product [marine sediment metagenome]|uniref:L-threonylcarbamoyladenylate synthase n=1 Tax=marine sediment metagenome TaxID=412755 RepID=X1K1V1_9ZZZZ
MLILKVDQRNLKTIVKITVKSIKQGEVVVCPTDTIYGLLADATNEKAIKKLLKIKKRRTQKPIPIFVKDLKVAKRLAQINKNQEKFLRKVWPGKVTTVLKRKNKLPKILFAERKTIGLRIPDYKIINQLLFIINRPLTGTSANISGKPPSTKIKEVISQFKNQKFQPDLIIDVGNLPKSKPSIVFDLTIWPPKILRL